MLPLRDADGRSWWVIADPYHGLSTRTRHPERSLYLADGTEFLVTMGYVRGPPRPAGLAPAARRRQRIVITLRGAQQRARLERSRADLVSTVAHELRSPLTSVKGFTATLLAKWSRFTDDQKRVMLETVNADADRVTRLITELLDVSRIEAGRIEVHRELVDIPDRAGKIVAGRVAAGDAQDRFRLEVRRGLPETWLDADKVDQILGNLIENAVRHGAGTVTSRGGTSAPGRPPRPGDRRSAVRPRSPCATRATASRRSSCRGSSASSGGPAPRRRRARPVHREGPGRGARRDDHACSVRPAAAPSSDLPCPPEADFG